MCELSSPSGCAQSCCDPPGAAAYAPGLQSAPRLSVRGTRVPPTTLNASTTASPHTWPVCYRSLLLAGVGSSCLRCVASTTLSWESDPHESQHRRASHGVLRRLHGLRVRSRGRALRSRRDDNSSKPTTWKPPHARAVMAERRHAELLRSSVCGGLRTWPNDCPTSVCAWHACAAHHDACEHRSTASHVPLELPKTVVGRAWAVSAFVAWRARHWLGNPTHTNHTIAALHAVR